MSELTKVGFAEYGEELVVNGDFSDGLNEWIPSTGITSNNGVCNFDVGDYTSLRQPISLMDGMAYQITFNITSIVSGSIRPYLFGSTNVVGTERTKVGTYTDILVANSSSLSLYISSVSNGFNGSIDNVSVKEVICDPNKRYLVDHGRGKHNRFAEIEASRCTGFNGVDNNVLIENVSLSRYMTFSFNASVNNTSNVSLIGRTSGYKGLSLHDANSFNVKLTGSNFIPLSITINKYVSYHYVIVVDNQDLYIYVDNVLVGQGTQIAEPNGSFGSIAKEGNSYGDVLLSSFIVLPQALTPKQVKYLYEYPELSFSHFNVNDAYKTNKLPDITAELNMPLIEKGRYKIDYSKIIGGELLTRCPVQVSAVVVNNGDGSCSITGDTDEWCYFRFSLSGAGGAFSKDIQAGQMLLATIEIKVNSGSIEIQCPNGENKQTFTNNGIYTTIFEHNGDVDLFASLWCRSDNTNVVLINSSVREATAYELANYTTASDITDSGMNTALLAPDGKMDSALHGSATLQIPNSKHGSTTQEVILAENETVTKLGFNTYNNLIKEN